MFDCELLQSANCISRKKSMTTYAFAFWTLQLLKIKIMFHHRSNCREFRWALYKILEYEHSFIKAATERFSLNVSILNMVPLKISWAKTVQIDHQGDLRKIRHNSLSYMTNVSKTPKQWFLLHFDPFAKVCIFSSGVENATLQRLICLIKLFD